MISDTRASAVAMRGQYRHREHGFSLLEVLIALTILSIAMGGFFAQLRSHTHIAITLQERAVARAWLEHYLLAIQLGEENYALQGQTVRDERQRYTWYLQSHVDELKETSLKRLTLQLYRPTEVTFPTSEDELADMQLVTRLSGVIDDTGK